MMECATKTTRHFINGLESAVKDSLVGFASSHANIQVIEGVEALIRCDYLENVIARGRVAILSGAGSGHEPFPSGFIGHGGLTGSLAGQIFSSPTTGQVLKVLRVLARGPQNSSKGAGVLLVICNYTGDRLNFGLACERARLEGLQVDMFAFSDDVAFYGEGRNAGRRGLAGVALFNKIVGALAEEGLTLEELKAASIKLNKRIGTMSISLSACDVPGGGRTFRMDDDELEVGLGIHGEPGINKCQLLTSREAVRLMLDHLEGPKSPLRLHLARTEDKPLVRIAVLLNNLGGLSNFELNILSKDALEVLAEKQYSVERFYCGTFCTSFSMPGVSLSILTLDDQLVRLLDAGCDTPVWPGKNHVFAPNSSPVLRMPICCEEIATNGIYLEKNYCPFERKKFDLCVTKACEALIQNEALLNELDKEGGDGDTGTTYKKGALAMLTSIQEGSFEGTFLEMANLCDEVVGGTSGALCSLMFTGASKALSDGNQSDRDSTKVIVALRDALCAGIETISKYSLAQQGDRTMLDTLCAVAGALEQNLNSSNSDAARAVVEAAEDAARQTATMSAQAGRASYVNKDRLRSADPGATAVAIWVKAVATEFL